MPGIITNMECWFRRDPKPDPNGNPYLKYLEFRRLRYFSKPTGEGIGEKVAILAGKVFHITAPVVGTWGWFIHNHRGYDLAKFFVRYTSIFTASAASLAFVTNYACRIRGVDDENNWMVGGGVAGMILGTSRKDIRFVPGFLVLGAFGGWLFGLMNPKAFLYDAIDLRATDRLNIGIEENRESYFRLFMPDAPLRLHPFPRGSELPIVRMGEEFEMSKLLLKQKYGYLESELDKVPEYERILKCRR